MPFKPGLSGNPGGKHKERIFRNALLMELKAAGEDMPELREAARGLISRAKGDNIACKELADRVDGKVPQAIVGDDNEDPIRAAITIIENIIEHPGNKTEDDDGGSVPPATEAG